MSSNENRVAVLSGASEQYLRRLGESLQALGPDESHEVLAELRSHLTEAIGEASGAEAGVLASFGTPEVLALRILEERGVVTEGIVAKGAPLWMRGLAFLADVAFWVVACMLVLLVNDLTGSRVLESAGEHSHFRFFSLWTWFIVAASVGAWWLLEWLRHRAHATIGMRILGLRRVRMGPTTRIVVKSAIPGLSQRGSSLGALVTRTPVAVALLAGVCLWFFTVAGGLGIGSVSAAGMRDSETLNYYSGAVKTLSMVYGDVLAGHPALAESMFAPGADDVLSQLKERCAAGRLAYCSIIQVGLAPYTPLPSPGIRAPQKVQMLIYVDEFGKGADFPATYECTLTETWINEGHAAMSDGCHLR